jgi:hypothetical protein
MEVSLMRKLVATLAVLTLSLVGAKLLLASDAAEKTTLKGELLDLVCYMTSPEGKAEGAAHADCAVKCVKSGVPMGFKAEDGKVYLVIAEHGNEKAFESAKEYCGKKVEVTGVASTRGEMHVLVISSAKTI